MKRAFCSSRKLFFFVKLLLVMYRFKRKRENETMHTSTLSCCVLHSKPITAGLKGASLWLTAIPLKDQGSALNKQEFRDYLRLRYNLPLQDLPSTCACGQPFNVSHALSCKKGGFVAQRHDGVRNQLTYVLSKVFKNVQVKPHLQPLDNEAMNLRSATTSSDPRLDVKAGGFWSRGETALLMLE